MNEQSLNCASRLMARGHLRRRAEGSAECP